ncbi:MAG: hypothetical protein AB1589_18640 [Cyanobacteriota bacterium]
MLKRSYDSNGELSTIHIQIGIYHAQVPYSPISKSVEWQSIVYEPTKQSIQSAWDDWAKDKDLSVELADRTDLSPAPIAPSPDWAAFNRLAAKNNSITQILTATTNQFAAIQLQLIGSPAGYSVNGLAKEDYPLFQGAWAQVIAGLAAPLAPDVITELNAIATSANMDFTFDSQGLIVY